MTDNLMPVEIGKIEHDGETLSIWQGVYNDNKSPAIFMKMPSGEPYAKLTVNLGLDDFTGPPVTLPEGAFFVRPRGIEDLLPKLLETGLFEDTGDTAVYGRAVVARIWKFKRH